MLQEKERSVWRRNANHNRGKGCLLGYAIPASPYLTGAEKRFALMESRATGGAFEFPPKPVAGLMHTQRLFASRRANSVAP